MAGSAQQLPEDDQPDIRPKSAQERANERWGVGGSKPSSDNDGADNDATGDDAAADNERQGLTALSGGGQTTARKSGHLSSVSSGEDSSKSDQSSEDDEEGQSKGKQKKGVRGWYQKHKKAVLVSGAVSVLLGGGGGFMALPSIEGSVLIHESKIFSRFFGKDEHDSSSRTRQMFRFLRAIRKQNWGEIRMNSLGSKIFGGAADELASKGITFETNQNGSLAKVNIDTEKLKSKFPELEGMNPTEQKDFLRNTFGLEGDAGYSLFESPGGGGKYTVDARYLDFKTTRALGSNAFSLLEDGKIPTWMKFRYAAEAWDLPSAFHPWKKTLAKVENKIYDKASITQEQQKEEADREKALQENSDKVADPKVDEVKSRMSGVKGAVLGALTFTGAACAVYDTADAIATIDHIRVVTVAEEHANDVSAGASQMENGGDSFPSWAPGAMVHNQVDKTGKGIFQSAAWNAISTDGNDHGGYRMPVEYQQAFSDNTTAAKIRDGVDKALGGTGHVLCSGPGTAGQIALGLGLSLVGDPATLVTPKLFGIWLGKEGASFAASGIAMHFVQSFVLNKATLGKLADTAFKGAMGGELLAYGARSAANMAGMMSGGVQLGNTTSTMYASQMAAADHQEFEQKSAFARVFDINDYQSLTGHMADVLVPAFSGGATSFASGILNIGHTLSSAFSMFLPKVSAAQAYDWQFGQTGLPPQLLNDPQLQNPWDNAEQTVNFLASNSSEAQDDMNRAMACFGNKITNDNAQHQWEAFPTKEPNPASTEYTDAHCNDLTNENWNRVIMFVYDSNTMNAIACYQGDQDSCNKITGQSGNAPGATTASTTSTPAGGDWFAPSDTMPCAAGTDEGVQDGYNQGTLVKIKICNVQGIRVNARIAANVNNLLNDAKAAGINFVGGSGGFRTMADQIAARQRNNCPSVFSGGADTCHPPTALPGYSNHQMGLAIDFDQNGQLLSSGMTGFAWLQANAAKYGLKNLPSENWHWSVDGN